MCFNIKLLIIRNTIQVQCDICNVTGDHETVDDVENKLRLISFHSMKVARIYDI